MRLLALARGPFAATRRRLLLMNLLVVSAMIGAMAVAVYVWEAQITDQQITQDVMDRAGQDGGRNVATLRGPHTDSGPNAPVDGDPSDVYAPSSPNVFTVLLDAQGNVVSDPGNVRALGLPDMAAARPVLSGQESSTLVTIGDDEHAFRLYTSAVSDHGQVIGALQIGASLASRSRQLHGLLMTLVLVGVGMLGLTALASLFLTDRALSPTRAAYERERRFVSAASHELRTPLAIVRSQAELVSRHLRRLSGPQDVMSEAAGRELADDVDEITDEVDFMTRLVHDLLALARSESEREDGPTQVVDLVAVAEGCVTRLRPQADANGLALLLADTGPSEHAPVMVRADADRLRRLLLILLENALAYTPSGGSITVSVETQTGRAPVVLLNVADTGKGISPEDLPHVFEPFYRADPARRHSHHSGSGLGLALARQIAHSLGGEITVKSEPGVGSTFTVRLPYSAGGDS